MMELICSFCERAIKGKGKIHNGEPYHESCLGELQSNRIEEDLEALHEKFQDMDHDALDDLYYYYAEFDKVDYMHRCLEKAPWAVVTRGLDSNGFGEIQIDGFTSKTKLCNWLAGQLYENFHEDGMHWEVTYILRKGKVVANWNEFEVKVTLPEVK